MLKKWYYVGVMYSGGIGVGKLYVDNKLVVKKRMGKMRFVMNYFVRMGVRIGDSCFFKGRILCM